MNVLNYIKVQKVDFPKVCVAGLLTDICIDDFPQLTKKFGLAKVKKMLRDIVNSCYDGTVKKQKAEDCIVLEHGLTTILFLALMSPSTARAIFSLVSCLSRDVSELLMPVCIGLTGLFQIFQRRFPPVFWTPRFSSLRTYRRP